MRITNTAKRLSLVLKILIIVSAALGVTLSAAAGRNSFMGGSAVFMYFTIQSNIAIALICAAGALILAAARKAPRFWYVIKLVGTVSITLTGVVFCFVLAPVLKGAAWSIPNILTHVVVPIAAVLDFFVTGVFSDIRPRLVFYVIIPPLMYAVYAGIGYVKGWEFAPGINYPYFFLNWGSPAGVFGFTDGLPFMGTGWWIIAILIFLLLVGILYLGILRILKKLF